jgi:protein-tyrosine phosphatase
VQITANAFTGHWGKRAQDTALWLLRHSMVHELATDAHDTRHRPPVLSRARDHVARIMGEETAFVLLERNSRGVVDGQTVFSLDMLQA